ncbi:MAG: hypothetical protein HC911_17410 [Chloroflexaceae bacterium]|nr:hypothetical protein [Chloroflexaceae bacterium]
MTEAIQPANTQTITFYGDEILAIQEPQSGRIYVPIGRMCENLQVDRSQAHARISAGAVSYTHALCRGDSEPRTTHVGDQPKPGACPVCC